MVGKKKGWGATLLQEPIPGDVVKCLNELGVSIRRIDEHTGEVEGWCPAHIERTGKQDRHPSWGCNMESGRMNCFSCGFRGPFVLLVEYMLRCSRDEAVAWVKARGGIDRAKKMLSSEGKYVHELAQVTEADLALYVEAPEWACHERYIDPEDADFYGLLWDEEKELWITPVRDPWTGKLVGWQEKAKGHSKNFPPSMEKSKYLFGLQEAMGESDECVLTEAPLDVPRIRSAGVLGAVGSMGAHISDVQLDLICDNFTHLISALDNDAAGDKANAELRDRIGGRIRLSFWNYGETVAKDPGEQMDVEVRWSYENAYSSILAVW